MSHDAQRELERRALRNVRGLLDKLEQDDKVDRGSQRRIAVAVVVVVVGMGAVLGYSLHRANQARKPAQAIELAPAQATPQPPPR
jgi:hypothetical protein